MTGSALSTGGGFCWFRWFCWCLLQGGVVFCAVAWTDFCGLLRSACQQVAKRDPECGAASLCALMEGHAKSGLKCPHWPPNCKPIIDEYRARGLNNGDGMLPPVDQSVIAERRGCWRSASRNPSGPSMICLVVSGPLRTSLHLMEQGGMKRP